MKTDRSTSFTWNLTSHIDLNDRFRQEVRHAVYRICELSTSMDPGKHHLLINLSAAPDQSEVELTLRHGRFLSYARDQGPGMEAVFAGAAATLEEVFKRRRRFHNREGYVAALPRSRVEPIERMDTRSPRSPRDVLAETIGDYLRRMRRHVRRRLQFEAISDPERPVASISDGDVVDDAAARMLRAHPSEIPFGAFWPWAIHVCDDVVSQHLKEACRLASSSVSLDEELPPENDTDPGFDVEQPFYIIERLHFPPEEELEDATADERAVAPSFVAEYEDFVRYLREHIEDWPTSQRLLVERYCFEGLHPSEIAALEGTTEAKVNASLNECLGNLRQFMKDSASTRIDP